MQRRSFIKSSILAAGIGAAGTVLTASSAEPTDKEPGREFYELRKYRMRQGHQPKLLAEFLEKAAIPALRRAGTGPVGVFNLATGPGSPSTYVLIPHPSPETMVQVNDTLDKDEEYQKAGAEFLDAPFTEPAFERVESSFMRAFKGMPHLSVPAKSASGKSRVYELRTYESHGRKANLSKIGMFNDSELTIFKRAGLEPVFFGENLIADTLPSLTYMLSYEDMAAHDEQWKKFGSDPEWKKLGTLPGFRSGENVSNISNYFLKPAPFSQI
jgi:hypothetical protein